MSAQGHVFESFNTSFVNMKCSEAEFTVCSPTQLISNKKNLMVLLMAIIRVWKNVKLPLKNLRKPPDETLGISYQTGEQFVTHYVKIILQK